jgi:ubiquinone/menaquinone biosynthesis C-methylase UbiE
VNSIELLEKTLKDIRAGKVLDIATGAGEFLHTILEFSNIESITALDSGEFSAKIIAENFPDVEFILADAVNMPFEDEFFDTVCMSNSLHHMPDIDCALFEMLRVLRKGGNFVLSEMHRDTRNEISLNNVRLHHWSASIDRKIGRFHAETFGAEFLRSKLADLNLDDLAVIEFEWPVENPFAEEFTARPIGIIETTIERLSCREGFDEIISEGRGILDSIRKNGYGSPPFLFFWGRKAKG